MTKPVFTEVIKVLDGKFCNPTAHWDRMFRTSKNFFGTPFSMELSDKDIPEEYLTGLVKCRMIYSDQSCKVQYQHYAFRQIKSLRLVEDNNIDYAFKYADREELNALLFRKGDCDDVLIVKNGCITDTSYTNVVLENATGLYTPSTYLLAGTKRQQLLDKGIISEREIRVSHLKDYNRLYLINTMIDLEDNISIDISKII
ncbi:4-amino-4-deoxychorismate lyase [Dysgonomonas sp. PFB1-18]|uniref:aminotransferase class IV n=1 Tax=unclassified Dysgonomonas TaxID=2630389 RepID=UPI0024752386|nr:MULTISPECIES: aminotransferase class IV [unclassified Dysgonomonas]MDH6308425.1 4-amino-4-deoxychorismate lyase [Dysgonomonas sp. PF1-14]MDH6337926.1 4-amino-4-deoxychorismate lyase [Dysgonomonas sp. PF1-16]MDH6379423.1 4-amino-4-deoxychorismate lyase [Dysgonomonas sp. PFB1-18]MDH6396754.1 4-amino-4-deoxychorismate lyase [Dysgonomonas sp. PF1-23]